MICLAFRFPADVVAILSFVLPTRHDNKAGICISYYRISLIIISIYFRQIVFRDNACICQYLEKCIYLMLEYHLQTIFVILYHLKHYLYACIHDLPLALPYEVSLLILEILSKYIIWNVMSSIWIDKWFNRLKTVTGVISNILAYIPLHGIDIAAYLKYWNL